MTWHLSAVPTGLTQASGLIPTAKAVGYFHVSLRDGNNRLERHRLWRHCSAYQVILRRNAKRIGDAVEKCKERGNVDRFGNLILRPTRIAEFLHVFGSGAISGIGHELCVIEQGALGRSQAGVIELALKNCVYCLVRSSLNPQEVSVAVQSIRTPVQVRDIAGYHLFMAAIQMTFRKMDGVGEVDHLTQEVRARAETLDDARNLSAAR